MRRIALHIITAAVLLCAAGELFSRESSQALYEQGMEAFKSGNYGSAGLIFRKIVDADDDYRDRAWYHLGLSVFRQKKYESAIFEFNRFLLECTTSNLCAQSRYWIAESEYHRKKYIKAIEEYNRFIAQKPDEKLAADSMKRIGEIYFAQNRYDEAVLVWKKTLDRMPDEPKKQKLNLKIGEALFLNEQYDEAVGVLEAVRASRPDAKTSARASLSLGRIYQLKGNHRKALRQFGMIPEPMLKEKPYYDAQYFRALSHVDLGQQYSAKSSLEIFLIIGKESDWYNAAKYELGKIYIGENREAKGVRLLEEARNNTVKMELRSKAAMALAKIYLKKDPKEAIPYLEDSVSLNDPEEQKNALMLLSRVYIDAQRNDDAERLLELLVNKYPYDSNMEEVQFMLSRVYLSRGQLDKAVQGFNRIREINPFSRYLGETPYYLGIASYNDGKPAKAIEHLNKYLAGRNPEMHYQANEKLHAIYIETGDYAGADKVMANMMRRYRNRPGMDELAYSTGLAYMEKGRRHDYLFDYVVDTSPRSALAGKVLLLQGDAAFRKKEYAPAERYYRQHLAVPGRENASSVYLYRVISLYRLERYRDVVRVVGDEKIPPGDEFTEKLVRLWEGKSLYRLGRFADSLAKLKEHDLTSMSDEDLSMMVKLSLRTGDVDRARRSAGLLSRTADRHAEALFDLGMFFRERKEADQSRAYFGEVTDNYPESAKAPQARLESAEIMIDKKEYTAAVTELEAVKDPGLEDRKQALLVSAYFGAGMEEPAIAATEKNIAAFQKSPHGERAFRDNLVHYYEKKDAPNFKRMAGYLKKFPGTGSLVGYYTGKLEYDTGGYSNAYYSFYKLTSSNNEYRAEALYRLGLISLYVQENRARAMAYFSRLAKEGDTEDSFVQKSKIILAVDAHQQGNAEAAKKQLAELMGNARDRAVLDRSMNLFEHFGFYKDVPGKGAKK